MITSGLSLFQTHFPGQSLGWVGPLSVITNRLVPIPRAKGWWAGKRNILFNFQKNGQSPDVAASFLFVGHVAYATQDISGATRAY
jgi:hypothetical protein